MSKHAFTCFIRPTAWSGLADFVTDFTLFFACFLFLYRFFL